MEPNNPTPPIAPYQQPSQPTPPPAVPPAPPIAPDSQPKSHTKLIIIIVVAAVVVVALIITAILLFMFAATRAKLDNTISSSQTSTNQNKTVTPCYSFTATSSNISANGCTTTVYADEDGYYPIDIIWYDRNSSGDFASSIRDTESSLKNSEAVASVTKESFKLDGVSAVRFTLTKNVSENSTHIDAQTGTTYVPTRAFIMADTSERQVYNAGKRVLAVSISTGQDTESQKQELKNILASWKWPV